MGEDSAAHVPPRAKRLPFKPTALRRRASTAGSPVADTKAAAEDDDLDLFRRGKEMQPVLEADRDRRLKKKKQQRKKEREREREQEQEQERRRAAEMAAKRLLDDGAAGLVASDVHPQASLSAHRPVTPLAAGNRHGLDGDNISDIITPPASKRSRLDSTPSNSISLASTAAEPLSHSSPPSARFQNLNGQPTPPPPLSHPRENGFKPRATPVVVFESDEESCSGHDRGDSGVEIVSDPLGATDQDDEFDEYVRRAEEQRAKDQAMLASVRGGRGQDGAAAKETVDLVVTSPVPDSKPCRVKFLYDKPLRVVRDTWLALQKQKGVLLEVETREEVVLTWRRKKVYAASTLLHLGIRPEGNGRIKVDGPSTKGLAENRTRVHMEAWTVDLFRQMEREEELQRQRDAGELSEEEELAGPNEAGPPTAEIKIRVILKARHLGDVKLTVRPETTVETLITGFRTQRELAPGSDVGIWFDGSRLEEHVTMEEAEIDDMDTMEVHVK
ncbi:uncharacterized protein UV8b_02948 [Ustilaginoidea virens]|uniref:Ubiquitin-like domain-containing protein n=1 Tax=Ustilaginoidea virens TaxID=1159556 RepID=A0A8E5MGB8_USTVR|nr:uncharacterized protein UV8b_02948 [Ustilaginoidea virens]QUC18707.1 hypothetical protein UV8b_02948 [Ustilaginoidea virens]